MDATEKTDLMDMSSSHKFKDEWLIRAIKTLPQITPETIEKFREQRCPSLSHALLVKQLLTEESLADVIQQTFHVGYVNPILDDIDNLASSLVPEKICRRYQLLPIGLREDSIKIAMVNPLNMDAVSDVQAISGRMPVP